MKVSYVLIVLIVVLIILNGYVFLERKAEVSNVSTVSETLYPDSMSTFARGEYHFNTHGDLSGPYNRERARYYYQQAIIEGDTNPLVWYQLGRLDFLDGNYTAAIERFNKQIELHGDTIPNVYYSLGLVYGFRASLSNDVADWQLGAKHFRTFIDYVPDSPWARTDLAWILFALGEYEEMEPVLRTGLETHPDHPWLLNMYGLVLMHKQEYAAASEVFSRSLAGARLLTVEDWGRAYPGNHPASWGSGLEQFIAAIEKNLELSNAQVQNS